MVVTLREVTVIGFSIAEPVGVASRNQPDDIFVIKTLLNGIAAGDGGADGTLDMSDNSGSDEVMEPVIEAILSFQKSQPGLLHDGRVDPEKNTIKRMRSLFKRPRGGATQGRLLVRPDGPIVGPCDAAGFSAARLKSDGSDWSSTDPTAPIRQMVPVGKTRRLRVDRSHGARMTAAAITDGAIATILDTTDDTVTVVGGGAGETDLRISFIGHTDVVVRLLVRAAVAIPIDVVHLGQSPLADPIALNTQKTVTTIVSRIFENQANVTFTAGTKRTVGSIVDGGTTTPIDGSKPIRVMVGIGPMREGQGVHFDQLRTLVTNARAVTMVVSNFFVDDESEGIAGRGDLNRRILWFNPLKGLGSNAATLPAHEIGHSLGMNHVTVAAINRGFLMNPVLQSNNFIIPCETLTELSL